MRKPSLSLPWSGWFRLLDPGMAPAPAAADVDAVRRAMRELAQQAPGPAGVRLLGSIERAPDLQSLWFLRSSLIQALAAGRGERGAHAAKAGIDPLLPRGWPAAPVSSPGRLG
jgi:hypothetical protein